MKRILIMLSFLLIAGGTAYAQEGRKNWKTEHTLRLRAGFFTEGVMFTSGIRVRCYKNLHLFMGPTIATDCIGLHLGIGF